MKTAAKIRRGLKTAKNIAASQIAPSIRNQSHLDLMLMRYPEARRRIIFRNLRPFLRFDAIFPTEANTATVTPESFAKLKEKYGETIDRKAE
jgi:hypothetical protein